MIYKLKAMAVFAAVVEHGSFRAAAEHFGLAPSRISQTISDLEADLGVTLLYRSTRKISVTNEGMVLFEKVQVMLEAATSGLDAIRPGAAEPNGKLKITVPGVIAMTELMDWLASFVREYPKIDLTVHFSDHQQDLISNGYDLAIRASGLIRTPAEDQVTVHEMGLTLVASPLCAAQNPLPHQPEDLNQWPWVQFERLPQKILMLGPNGRLENASVQASVVTDSSMSLYGFTAGGCGVAVMPNHVALPGIERGELVRVLPEWSLESVQFCSVWPNDNQKSFLGKMLVDYLEQKNK